MVRATRSRQGWRTLTMNRPVARPTIPYMRRTIVNTSVVIVWLLAACGPVVPGASSEPTPSPSPSPSSSPSPSPSVITGGGGGGGGGASGGVGGGGGGTNSAVRRWSETVDRSGGGVQDVVHQEYEAAIRFSLTLTDASSGSYDITGRADITSAFTEDMKSACSHYTDDASGSGSTDVRGGLEARDGMYQFHLEVDGLTGSNNTVRDDSPCSGPNNRETTEWPIAPITCFGEGTHSGKHLVGSMSTPREGGQDVCSWDFTLP